MLKRVLFAVFLIYELGIVSSGADVKLKTQLTSVLKDADCSDFKNFNDFLLSNGTFNLEKYMKLCEYSNLDDSI